MLELHYARRAQRRTVELPVELMTRDWDEPVLHRMTDISPYGVWVKTSFPRAIGERIVMSFMSPHGKELTVFAEVTRRIAKRARRRESGMGLEFVDLGQRDRVALHRALRGLPPRRRSRRSLFRRGEPS
ncbi:MAG: PilZ domain-containing protein [Myxococcales bacterium]|nr:PilZ domain-containing protein [Myxococcales bacterium]